MSLAALVDEAIQAQTSGKWLEALAAWNNVLHQFPTDSRGYVGVGTALQLLKNYDEAEDVLRQGLRLFPGDAHLAVEHARVAHRRENWQEALNRWVLAVARFPDNAEGFCGTGVALQMLGRLDDADAFLKNAIERFAQSSAIAIEYARVAHRRKDWEDAVRRWDRVISRFPTVAEGVAGRSVALQLLGRYAEAEAMLSDNLERFPTHAQLAIDYARMAHQRRDWDEAISRWLRALDRFPQNTTILEGLGSSRFQANAQSVERGEERVDPGRGPMTPDAELMMKFESLGSGCEFGLVQRRFGVEPLGLLRWGAIPPLSLARALGVRFENLGHPENVILFEFGESKEYFFRDKSYCLEMHTFVPVAGTDYDRLFAQQCRRAQFLVRKLLDDLENAGESSKIFVYKRHVGSLSDEEMMAIHSALRRLGNHSLLCVRPENEDNRNGKLDYLGEGLFVGYLDALSPTSNAKEIRYDSWLHICRKTYAQWLSQREESEVGMGKLMMVPGQ